MRKESIAKRIEKFWAQVDRTPGYGRDGDCWEWQGCVIHKDTPNRQYGHYRYEGRIWMTHRLAYFLTYGVRPNELRVLHKCDNPRCCRPDHLFLGTDADNVRDKFEKGRGGQGETHWTKHKPERIARGEKQHSAKMTPDQVREMRALWDAKELDSYQLAEKFGIRQSSAYKICSRQSWKHIE